MRGGGGAVTLAALPTPLGSTVALFIPPAFAGPGAIPLIGTFPATAEPALRANCANEAAGAAATTARIATAIFVEVLDMATLQLTSRDYVCLPLPSRRQFIIALKINFTNQTNFNLSHPQ